MEVVAWRELLLLLGGVTASAFALARIGLAGQRRLLERFAGFLESSIRRQESIQERLAEALDGLREEVRDQSRLLGRLAEREGLR
ncbi:MAG TPA: hypothetical protein PLH94_14655 [Fimbriimonadaceae bacterium]|nr:hypothetical protein [Fimbriimonadaceae bacterium]